MNDPDLLLVGGGLANGLIAWRLAMRRPRLRVVVLEAGDTLGGNHTWSFHEHDLSPSQHAWIAPLVAHSWPEYEVRFPGYERRLPSAYHAVTSGRFDERLRARLGDAVRTGLRVGRVEPDRVVLEDGTTLRAGAVIDGRGARGDAHLVLGWQKFLGLELRLDAPHGLAGPIVMDATVPKLDGYRFVYTLPFASDAVLVEDTYYADGTELPPDAARERVLDYARAQGWRPREILREERGVLPIVLGGDPVAFWDADGRGLARSGLGAALFHPTTGYSLPDAVRLADAIAALPRLDAPALHAATREWSLEQWRRRGFFRLLNRMLFRAAEPAERRAVFARFYRLPEPLLQRFYAARTTPADKLRILSGKPPVPIGRALRAMVSEYR
ncbi:MAG TPA: lycopene beta-cyclase CrtY [Burkholderiaceae bacterium]|nr:lycopene beta-cyclase CrtY [Burkholderiaceae bacterium]